MIRRGWIARCCDVVMHLPAYSWNTYPDQEARPMLHPRPGKLAAPCVVLALALGFSACGGSGECKPTGCSSQICAAEDIVTTCEWANGYQCYQLAECEAQASGECGWTPNDEFAACMKAARSPQKG
jgi:hypothetical protein